MLGLGWATNLKSLEEIQSHHMTVMLSPPPSSTPVLTVRLLVSNDAADAMMMIQETSIQAHVTVIWQTHAVHTSSRP